MAFNRLARQAQGKNISPFSASPFLRGKTTLQRSRNLPPRLYFTAKTRRRRGEFFKFMIQDDIKRVKDALGNVYLEFNPGAGE